MSIMDNIKVNLSRTGFKLRKAGPTIGVAVGVAGIGATAVLASRATLRAQETVKEHKEDIETIDEAWKLHKEGAKAAKDYDKKAYAHDHAAVWVHTGAKLLRQYAPAILTGIGSAALIICSHKVMSNRLAAMGAAYTVLQNTFAAYREKIEDHFGKEEVDEVINDRDKKEEEFHDKYSHMGRPAGTYSRVFGRGCTNSYQPDPMANLQFLSAKQNYWNDVLQSRGYVFLNEVYNSLGFESVPAGQMAGWLREDFHDKSVDEVGDGFIDFGVFESSNITDRVNDNQHLQWGDNILLDFNVDHKLIYDRI